MDTTVAQAAVDQTLQDEKNSKSCQEAGAEEQSSEQQPIHQWHWGQQEVVGFPPGEKI